MPHGVSLRSDQNSVEFTKTIFEFCSTHDKRGPTRPETFASYLQEREASIDNKVMAQYKGVIKWFNNAKGYGFIGREDGPDLFVHYSSIIQDGYKTLREGDEIEFDVVQGAKGPQADQVVVVKPT
jgi:CspA family cold shock protein